MVGISLLLLALDGSLGRLEGALLFAGILTYTGFLIRQSRRESAGAAADASVPAHLGGWLRNAVLVAAGLVLLVLGSAHPTHPGSP